MVGFVTRFVVSSFFISHGLWKNKKEGLWTILVPKNEVLQDGEKFYNVRLMGRYLGIT